MMKKQGITLTMMVITIIILIILASTIIISIYSTINYSRLSTWATEILYIQDVVDEQFGSSSTTNFTTDTITLDVSDVDTEILNEQFAGETISANNTVHLYKLDLGKLKITNINYGNLQSDTDVYAMSIETGRVYYVQGIEIDGKTYYSLTEDLKDRFNLNASAGNLTSIVFVPSKLGYSNNPISVTVKVPNTYSNIVISTSNSEITIGSQVAKEKTYEYIINSNLVAGNYTITVSYNDGVKNLVSKYEVNGYDVTKPVIHELTKENFVYKQTDTMAIDYLMNIKATDESGIKLIKYTIGTITEADAVNYFKENGNLVVDGKINLDRTNTIYTIYAEDYAGNFTTLTFDKIDYMEWVMATVDGVPIPKGFVASQATGENTKNGGLVIYEGTEAVTDENVEEAKRSRNQYVWVPVDDFTKFVRQDFGMGFVIPDTLGTTDTYWEASPTTELSDANLQYMTKETLEEVQAMYASVRKYGGFYIARYEAGIDTQRTAQGNAADLPGIKKGTKVYSMMGKIPYNYIPWTWNNVMNEDTDGAVEVARRLYPKSNINYGVISTLTYGVQWDRTLAWWLETGAKDIAGNKIDVKSSISYGNFYVTTITSAEDLNEGAKVAIFNDNVLGSYLPKNDESLIYPKKANEAIWALSTGALKISKVNNIYDMAGNMYEWVMEGRSTSDRVGRGGYHGTYESSASVAWRSQHAVGYSDRHYSFRVSLYIK